MKKDIEDTAPKKKFMNNKEKKKQLSRMQRKVCLFDEMIISHQNSASWWNLCWNIVHSLILKFDFKI